jgi:hypothetical protein
MSSIFPNRLMIRMGNGNDLIANAKHSIHKRRSKLTVFSSIFVPIFALLFAILQPKSPKIAEKENKNEVENELKMSNFETPPNRQIAKMNIFVLKASAKTQK